MILNNIFIVIYIIKDIIKASERCIMKNSSVTKKQAIEVSRVFKSFSHPTRLLMLCKLSEGASTVQQLQDACGLEQASTSQFLARLKSEGRVSGERRGNQVYYSLTDERLIELLRTLERLYCNTKS